MTVQRLGNQSARNDAGVTVSSRDRATMRVDYHDSTLVVPVDRGSGSYGFYIPAMPVWTDGTVVPPDVLAVLKSGIVEVMAYWNIRVEFL
ncbi:hypothetical protein ACIA8K_15825 [Catenuloplanes sp. NPDC051500]|uniref:hypothetical protein n=1 Tax=Catenuloplanes sp. NPDC051500 TaxID=3363959 RepID=UPI0037A9866B